jgi:transcription elongation factor GreA
VPNYLSGEGLEKVKTELQELKDKGRKEIAQRLEEAKALGDLSENSEYQEAREAQELLEQRILELEETVRNAVLIQKTDSNDEVRIGSTVVVDSKHGKETYTIVGSEEAKPSENKISNESPLGKSFLGHKAGERVEVKTPIGIVEYKVMQIM